MMMLRTFVWLYALLMRLLPRPHRTSYGAAMRELLQARLEDAHASGGAMLLRHGTREIADLVVTVVRERLGGPRPGRVALPVSRNGGDGAMGVRLVVRSLLREPGFTLAIVLTLALGIGAATSIFSIASGVLLRPLPYADASRVMLVWGHLPHLDLGFDEQPIHGSFLTTMRQESRTFEALAGFKPDVFNVTEGTSTQRIDGARATGDFFAALGVRPVLGRFFTESDEPAGANRVVVLSYDLWQRLYGGSASAIGSVLRMSGESYEVIGVAPRGFTFPRGGELPGNFRFPVRTLAWVPMAPATRGPTDLAVIGRVREGVTQLQAQAELERIADGLAVQYASSAGRLDDASVEAMRKWLGTTVVGVREQTIGPAEPLLRVLTGAVGVLMLIGCANAAQLLLARSTARAREFAVRVALGARRRALIRHVALEALLLAGAAGVLGSAFAYAGVSAVRLFGPARFPRLADVTIDAGVLGFALGLTAVTALLFGFIPAVASSRIAPQTVLQRGGRSGAGMSTRLRRGFIVAEVALSLMLLTGAGLLVRTLARQLAVDIGFTPESALTFELTLPGATYPELPGEPTFLVNDRIVDFLERATERVRNVPGVQYAAVAKPLPLSGAQEASVYLVDGEPVPADQAEAPFAEYTVIGPEFFRSLGAPLIAGREFTTADRADSEQVVVVNRALAEEQWPGEDAIGKRIKLPPPNRPWMTVVGIAPDLKLFEVTEAPRPVMYVPFAQRSYVQLATTTIVVRTDGDPLASLSGIRAAIAELDPEVPVANVEPMSTVVARATSDARFAATLVSGFAGAALVLAAVGLWGLIAFIVTQRRRELGVRMALGATRGAVARLVLADGGKLVAVGCAFGLAGALATTRLLQSLLWNVSPLDPVTLVVVPLLLLVIALGACAAPALRAARLEPRRCLED